MKPDTSYDDEHCDRNEAACLSLNEAIVIANDHDIIRLNDSSGRIHSLCHEDADKAYLLLFSKNLKLIGNGNVPARVGCQTPGPSVSNSSSPLIASPRGEGVCHVAFTNIIFENVLLLLDNCTAVIDNCTFSNASIRSLGDQCEQVDVTLFNSRWMGKQECSDNGSCIPFHPSNLTCHNVTLKVQDCEFLHTSLAVKGLGWTRVLIDNSVFSKLPDQIQYLGGLHLTFNAQWARILIKDSLFEKQIHPTRVQSVINLYESAIWLKANKVGNQQEMTQSVAIITNCRFFDNERAITMVGPFSKLRIENSHFEKNMAMHAGAALLVLVSHQTTLRIDNCSFINNVAGEYRDNYPIRERDGAFEVVGSEVHVNTDCCKGVITLVGKGGAIRVQRGVANISNSKFINNTARLLGACIFVDIDGTLLLKQSYLENTPVHHHALQGDILYSDGIMLINNVVLMVRTAVNGLSLLRHSGKHWTLDITNVWVECPIGYDLRATNSSAYGVAKEGLRRSYKLDQLSYFCESCPRNKYSLDHGYLNYTMVFNEFSYFTLLINNSVPKPEYTGKYIHHIIQCEDCPYGGHCVEGITAVANFWGYEQNKTVRFQHCPKGYCCSTPECGSIDSCSTHRHGLLCGRCKPGFSEALFSPDCVPNSKCGPSWLYPFGFSIGLTYALFLLLQTDLKEFLFTGPLTFSAFCKCFHRTKKSPYMNGKVSLDIKADGSDSKFIPHSSSNSSDEIIKDGNAEGTENSEDPNDHRAVGSGLLIILFYYFQDALLLHVKTVYVNAESKTQQLVKTILSGLFKFQLDLFELIEEVCAIPDMSAVPKVVSKALIVPYVILIFFIMYLIHRWIRFLRRSSTDLHTTSDTSEMIQVKRYKKSFSTRLSSGFILALMFMFQKLGTSTFTLLNCVPVHDKRVLYIDGTITCYERWQYGAMAYAVLCVSPFFLVLLVGPSLLTRRQISLSQFFVACLCPLPMLLWWTCHLNSKSSCCHRTSTRNTTKQKCLSEDTEVVLQILQGPFKENRFGLCWAGILIGRRLVLILLFTFVNDSLIRLLCMLLTCFVILLQHVHVQPYKDARGNVAGTTSAAALVTLGSINLVRAGFEAAEYTPTGPNAFLMKVFNEIENTLLLWLPLAIMSLVVLLLLFRIACASMRIICGNQHNIQNHTPPSPQRRVRLSVPELEVNGLDM